MARSTEVVVTLAGLALGLGVSAGLGGSVASAQQIAPGARAAYGDYNLSPGQRTVLQGAAGGPVTMSSVDGNCRGYASVQPSHTVTLPTSMAVRMVARAGFDTTLAVQLPNGQLVCNDDFEGLSAGFDFVAPGGTMRIWVGSYGQSNIGGGYQLDLQSGGGAVMPQPPPPQPPPTQGQQLDLSGRSSYGNLDFVSGQRVDSIGRGAFGGPVDAGQVGGNCRGTVGVMPNHVVMARSGSAALRFVVSSQTDTTMMIRLPDGRFVCDDDSGEDMNPLIETATGPGAIMVWVGDYGGGETGPYTIAVTENRAVTANNIGMAPPQGGTVVVTPTIPTQPPQPSYAQVDLRPRIPVTLMGASLTTPQVAVWSPTNGPRVVIGATPVGSVVRITVQVGGGPVQQFAEVPAQVAQNSMVTITQRADGRLLVRAENMQQQMLFLVQLANGSPAIAEQWNGALSDRAPRWSR